MYKKDQSLYSIAILFVFFFSINTASLFAANDIFRNLDSGFLQVGQRMHMNTGDDSRILFGPNSTYGAYLNIGAGSNNLSAGVAQVLSTNGNLHLDSGPANNSYINWYSQTNTFINGQGGNVGIGTTSPSYKLDVTGTYGAKLARFTAPSAQSLLLYGDSGGVGMTNADPYSELVYLQNSTNSIHFYTNGSNKGTINSSGNFGIGTTSPSYKLQVQKTSTAPAVMIGGGFAGSPRFQIYGLDADPNAWMGLGADMGGGPYEHSLYFPTGPSFNGRFTIGDYNGTTYNTRMTVLQNGNVGIGTTAPSAKLDVAGSIVIANNSNLSWGGSYGWNIPTIASQVADGIYFYPVGSTLGATMKINSSGNVGIGTTSPGAKLDIAGQMKITGGSPGAGKVLSSDATGLASWTNSLPVQSARDFPSGTLIQTDIDYSVSEGEPWFLEIDGNSYGSAIPFNLKYQGYIYSSTVINHGGISNGTNISGMSLFNYGGKLCFWFPNQSYWQGFTVNVNDSYAGVIKNRVTSITNAAKPGGITKEVAMTFNQSLHSGNYTSYAPSLTGVGASGTWGINVTGNAATATNATNATLASRVDSPDGDRNAATKLPTSNPRSVRFDFVSAGTANGGGNYAGLMTYAPWDGTTGSTGDASYQLAFNSTATNGGGIPYLSLRKGIDSTWNSWYTLLHSGNFNSYAPSLTGGGASGTWGINITGSAPWASITGKPTTVAGYGITDFVSSNSVNPVGADATTTNGHYYVNANIAQFGQTDGALFVQGYSSAWASQIFQDYRTGQIALRGKNSGTWQGWRSVLDSSNYTSYAPSLTGGGASGTWGINITGNAATASNSTNLGGVAAGSYARRDAGNTLTDLNYFQSNKGASTYVGGQSNYALQAFANDGGAAGMSFHRGGQYAVNMGLDPDNVLRIGGWSAPANRWELDMSGNMTTAGALRGANINISRSSTTRNGISWFSPSYTAWSEYMAPATEVSTGPYGNITAPTGSLVTSWGLRSFIENSTGYGWTWESGTSTGQPTIVAEIRASDGSARFAGSVYANNFYYNSDRSLKRDIAPIVSPLDKIMSLSGYTFTWKNTGRRDMGVIAQEVEKVFPDIVGESRTASGDTIKTVEYGNLVAPLIEAVKEQQEHIKKQDEKIQLLEEKINLLFQKQ